MSFRRQDLQEAFFVPGSHAFRVYGYGTTDPLEAVLRPGYFEAARSQLRPGELIFVSAGADRQPRHSGPTPGAGHADGDGARAALVMVSENARGVPVAARLVQDFGGPATGAPPPPRQRRQIRRRPIRPGAAAAAHRAAVPRNRRDFLQPGSSLQAVENVGSPGRPAGPTGGCPVGMPAELRHFSGHFSNFQSPSDAPPNDTKRHLVDSPTH